MERRSGKKVDSMVSKGKEKEMRRESTYIEVFRNAPAPLSVMTAEGRSIDTNLTAERYFKRSRDEIIGPRVEELYAEKDAEKIRNALERCKRTGFASCEVEVVKGDGTRSPAVINLSAVKDKDGTVVNIIKTAHDVTELRQCEQELKETKNYSQNVLDGAAAPILVLDRNSDVSYVNPAFEQILGYKKEECVGNTMREFMSKLLRKEDMTRIADVAMKTLSGEPVMGISLSVLTKERKELTVILSMASIRDVEGNVSGLVVTAMDVTELEEAKNYSQSVLDGLAAPVWMLDKNFDVGYVNPAFERAVGYKKEECVGNTMREFMSKLLRKEDRATIADIAAKVSSGEVLRSVSLTLLTKEKEELPILFSGASIRDVEGDMVGVVVTAMSITELREKEGELRKRAKELSRAVESFGDVLSSTAGGDLTARVDLSVTPEEYRQIGEDINKMILATEENIDELRMMGEELKKAVSTFGSVLSKAASGDLSAKVDLPQIGGEYAPIGKDINEMVQGLLGMVRGVKEASDQLSSSSQGVASSTVQVNASSQQISTTITQISQGASTQSTSLEEVKKSVDQVMKMTQKAASNARSMADQMSTTAQKAAQGSTSAQEAIRRSEMLSTAINASSDAVRGLGETLEEVSTVLEVITDVADQTNLLALNAAIEAARAGEHGRAFAVVAEEVKRLAERSRERAEKIGKMIRDIGGKSGHAMSSMDEAVESVTKGNEVIQSSLKALNEIAGLVQESAALSHEVFGTAQQQETEIGKISQAVEVVGGTAEETAGGAEEASASVQELAASMEELTATAQELKELSTRLAEGTARFTLGE